MTVIDANKRIFEKKMPPEDVQGLAENIARNAEYLARIIMRSGKCTMRCGFDNPHMRYKIIIDEVCS